MLRKVLLTCGIASALLYLADDVIAGTLWQGYDFTAQAFSDYSAIGAPTRQFILLLSPVYSALVIAFGVGVWSSAGPRRALRLIGVLFGIYALASWVWPQFFPIHLNPAEASSSDAMHIVLTFVTVFAWFFILGLGATAFGARFRWYSIATLLIVFGGGALSGVIAATAPSTATLAAPGLGIAERLNIYSFMLWVVVLAIALLRTQRSTTPRPGEKPTARLRALAR